MNGHSLGSSEAKLIANHGCIKFVPVVITDGSPDAVVLDFHPTFHGGRPADQTDGIVIVRI